MKHLKKFNENNMEMDVHGLKCDGPNCDWNDMSIPFDDYANHVNAPCPECGENILKEEEYQQLLQMKQSVDKLNQMSEDDIQSMLQNLSPEQMDAALDQMNDLKKAFNLEKTDNEDGTETWSSRDNIEENTRSRDEIIELLSSSSNFEKEELQEKDDSELKELWDSLEMDNWLKELENEEVNESLPRERTVKQWKKLRKMTRGTDIGDRIPDLMKQGANIHYSGNVVDRGIESYEDYERHNKKFVPSWNLKHLMSPFRGESKKKKKK